MASRSKSKKSKSDRSGPSKKKREADKKASKRAAAKADDKAKKAAKKANQERRRAEKKAADKHRKAEKSAKKAKRRVKNEKPQKPIPAIGKLAEASELTAAPSESWSVTALRARAREVSLPGYSRMSKAELIENLSELG